MSKYISFITLALAAIILSACASTPWSSEERTVYFETGKSTLTAEAKGRLDRLVGSLAARNVDKVDVVGYADHRGDVAYNEKLSASRAHAVAAYLGSKGFKGARVKTEARGESASTGCDDVKGEARTNCLSPDRKVEVKICMGFVEPSSGTNTAINHSEWQDRMTAKPRFR